MAASAINGDCSAFKLKKSRKTSQEISETTTMQGQYPTNTTVIAGDSIKNCTPLQMISDKFFDKYGFIFVVKTCQLYEAVQKQQLAMSYKKAAKILKILKILQNSRENICVGVSY